MATLEGDLLKGTTRVGNGGKATFTSESAMRVGDAIGRYTQAVEEGNVYIGSNLGGTPVTTQAGLSATTPALTLYNPVGSGVNLFLLYCGIAIQAAPAAAAELWIAYNLAAAAAPSSVTAANHVNAKTNLLSTGIGQCYRVATLAAAPLMLLALGGTTGAAAIGGVPLWFEIAGVVCVGPGVAISIQTSSATALTANFIWHERAVA